MTVLGGSGGETPRDNHGHASAGVNPAGPCGGDFGIGEELGVVVASGVGGAISGGVTSAVGTKVALALTGAPHPPGT